MSDQSRAIMPMYDKATNNPALANGGTPGAATAYFATALVVPGQCMRVTITFSPLIGTVFGYKRNGGALVNLQAGATLTASGSYGWTIPARPGDTLNFQDSAGAAVNELLVEGVHGGI